MNRSYFIKLLELYDPEDLEEVRFKEEMIKFVLENERCFDRSLEIGHVTASCWLVNSTTGSHALLMHHAKIGKWFQLGGHCDGNPDVLSVCIKEAQEESGIQKIQCISQYVFDLDIHLIPANKNETEHYHYDVRFLLQSTGDDKLVKNRESKSLMWVGKGDPLPTSNPSVVRMFNKWKLI